MNALRDSVILRRGLAAGIGPLAVFSLYLLFAGHNQPGGGFAGGLVAGVAVALAWATGGSAATRQLIRVPAGTLIGAGLALATAVGFLGSLITGDFLGSAVWEFSLPVFGDVKVVSSVAFDIGVYLVVVGMAAGMVGAVGTEAAEDAP